jgi:hypothetical protein
MTTGSQREFLKIQLLETRRLKEMAGDHPVMSVSLAEREKELRQKLAELSLRTMEATDPQGDSIAHDEGA